MVLHEPAEGVHHALHPAAEVVNREVALDECLEARIEPQSLGFVAQKLALERQPNPASVQSVSDEVVEVQGDHPQNP